MSFILKFRKIKKSKSLTILHKHTLLSQNYFHISKELIPYINDFK